MTFHFDRKLENNRSHFNKVYMFEYLIKFPELSVQIAPMKSTPNHGYMFLNWFASILIFGHLRTLVSPDIIGLTIIRSKIMSWDEMFVKIYIDYRYISTIKK